MRDEDDLGLLGAERQEPGRGQPSIPAELTARDVAERATILRSIVGSKLHGLNLVGTDDTDEMAVFIEPIEKVVGLSSMEHVIWRTQPEGHPSGPGDLDLAMYGLRKYVRLALAGNPTVLLLLFAPPEFSSVRTDIGAELQAMAPSFISRHAGRAFLGYLTAQKQRLLGERGGRALRTKLAIGRPQLSDEYDTKYAMHMIRLGMQGVELLTTGRLELPMAEPDRSEAMAIRQGRMSLNYILTKTGHLETRLEDLLSTSPIPDRADKERVEMWMIETYRRAWESA